MENHESLVSLRQDDPFFFAIIDVDAKRKLWLDSCRSQTFLIALPFCCHPLEKERREGEE